MINWIKKHTIYRQQFKILEACREALRNSRAVEGFKIAATKDLDALEDIIIEKKISESEMKSGAIELMLMIAMMESGIVASEEKAPFSVIEQED